MNVIAIQLFTKKFGSIGLMRQNPLKGGRETKGGAHIYHYPFVANAFAISRG
jgi:hypothetical protein